MRSSKRRRTASSKFQGQLAGPRTMTVVEPVLFAEISSNWVNSSVFMRRDASCSSEPREDTIASTSSINITEREHRRAASNKHLTKFSLSPLYLETRVDAEQLKHVQHFNPATAFARRDFPVPGGPNSTQPFHSWLIPRNSSGVQQEAAQPPRLIRP